MSGPYIDSVIKDNTPEKLSEGWDTKVWRRLIQPKIFTESKSEARIRLYHTKLKNDQSAQILQWTWWKTKDYDGSSVKFL